MRPFKVIRFGSMYADRIGSLAGNMGYYTCEKKHGIAHVNTFDIFYYYGDVSNYQLLNMWKRVVHVSYFLNYFSRTLFSKKYGDIHKLKTSSTDKYGLRAKTESFIDFTESEKTLAIKEMNTLGLKPSEPFVCLLSRDTSYLKALNPTKDWTYHDYRNCNIAGYSKAAEAMAASGNTFIRMGSVVTEPFVSTNPKVIDYAFKNYRTELLDIYLTANCKFFITTGTGLDTLANIFHRPVLYINFLPYTNFCFFPNVISVPKLLFSRSKNRLLTFKEILSTEIGNYGLTQQYENDGLDIIENTPEEILDAVIEMDMRLNYKWVEEHNDDELQRKFWMLFPKNTNYHAGERQSRVGAAFLRKHHLLLD
jgi:putative glycosyltransferase (TIGR04372 family)